MKRALLVLTLSLFAISCATQTQIKYQPPSSYKQSVDFIIIDMPQPVLFKKLISVFKSEAEEGDIKIEDEKAGQIAISLHPPDPEDYIDCGIVSYDDQTFPAAQAEQKFQYSPAGAGDRQFQRFADAKALGSTTGWALISAMASSPRINFTQTVELEVTVLFQLQSYGDEKTKVFAWPAYFVKRSLWGVSSSGGVTPTATETISFYTYKGAAFKDSTRCRSNYRMGKDMLTFISTVAELP